MREKKMRAKLEDFLQEVCEKTITNNQYPVLTSSKSGLFLQSDYFNKQVASKDNTGYKIIRRGQFTYRAMSDTGEFFPNMLECADVGIVSPAYPVFEIIKQDQIVPEYLNYYFKSNRFQNSISTFAQGSTRTSVKFGKLKKVSIELPEIKKQYQIIRTLDLLRTIINNRKKEVLELDELIRARFVELFGNPKFNDKGWNEEPLGNLCNVGSSKRIYQNEQTSQGIPFLRISDLVNRMDSGKISCELYIPETRYDELKNQNLVPTVGDILLTARGTLGRCYIIQPEDKFYFQDGMITWLSQFSDKITNIYISYLFEMNGFRKQIDSLQAGSTVAYLSISMTKKLSVMIPPIDIQNQFADFVTQIDKSKATVQKALDETQLLFDSLMQQYFG